MGKKMKNTHGNAILRFNPKDYPVQPGGWKNNNDTWKKLSQDLCLHANSNAHSEFIRAGSTSKGQIRLLRCCHYRQYKASLSAVSSQAKQSTKTSNQPSDSDGDRREYSFTGDRAKNSLGPQGQALPKNTSTCLSSRKDACCKVTLGFKIDQQSIYMVLGVYEDIHTGHAPIVPADRLTHKGIAPQQAMDDAKQAAVSNIGPGQMGSLYNRGMDANSLGGKLHITKNLPSSQIL